MKTLYNLTYDSQQYVSTIAPNNLPEDEYSFIEITYDEEFIRSVRAVYSFNDKKDEVILSDLDIFHYFNKIKKVNVDVEFMGVSEVEDKEIKFFILSLCSYLSYFSFMNLPYELSLDLLDNKAFSCFIKLDYTNELEKSWVIQVQDFQKSYSYLFPSKFNKEIIIENEYILEPEISLVENIDEDTDEINENIIEIEDVVIENIDDVIEVVEEDVIEIRNEEDVINKVNEERQISNDEIKKIVKEYIKGYMKEYIAKKAEYINKISEVSIQRIENSLKSSLERIDRETEQISKEIKEFKRRLMSDMSKHETSYQHY